MCRGGVPREEVFVKRYVVTFKAVVDATGIVLAHDLEQAKKIAEKGIEINEVDIHDEQLDEVVDVREE